MTRSLFPTIKVSCKGAIKVEVEEKRENGNKKKKEAMDKRKGEEMRAAALKGLASKLITVNCCYLTKMNEHKLHFRRMLVFC